jgi:hypothetical protein
MVDGCVQRVDLLKFCSASGIGTSMGSSASSTLSSSPPISLTRFSARTSLLSSLVIKGKTDSFELDFSSRFSSRFLKKGSFSKKVTCLEI